MVSNKKNPLFLWGWDRKISRDHYCHFLQAQDTKCCFSEQVLLSELISLMIASCKSIYALIKLKTVPSFVLHVNP